MTPNSKQAIKENWPMTIRAWCDVLEIGKLQRQMLEQYHREYTDKTFTSGRLGRPAYDGSRAPWLLTYDEFKILQEYRAKRVIIGRGRPKKLKKS